MKLYNTHENTFNVFIIYKKNIEKLINFRIIHYWFLGEEFTICNEKMSRFLQQIVFLCSILHIAKSTTDNHNTVCQIQNNDQSSLNSILNRNVNIEEKTNSSEDFLLESINQVSQIIFNQLFLKRSYRSVFFF